jgi:two-component system NtrC family sensor kinase
MSLRRKLIVIVLFVGLVPLVISSATTIAIHRGAFDRTLGQERRDDVAHVAALVRQRLDSEIGSLSLLAQRLVRWGDLTPEERQGALWLVYRQVDDVAVASLLDAEGKGVGPAAYQVGSAPGDVHPRVREDVLSAFGGAIPRKLPADSSPALGPVVAGADGPIIPVAIPVAAGSGRWVVAVALSLRGVCRDLAGGRDSELLLVDDGGRVLCRGGVPGSLESVDRGLLAAIADPGGAPTRYRDSTGREMIALSAEPREGFAVLARQRASVAFSAERRIGIQSAIWIAISLAIAVVSGLVLSRAISGPVRNLTAGAERLGRGEFAHRIPVESGDELGQLAAAFNKMGGEIETRDREIRAWNEELQKRVDERTAELRAAQDQLLQAQKIAAVTSLGAGFAHEMNSPLAAILARTQILIAMDKEGGKTKESLQAIEAQAKRLAGTVKTLIGITKTFVGEGFTALDVNDLLDAAIADVAADLAKANVTVARQYEPGRPRILGDRAQLLEGVSQIVDNARKAMASGGTLTLVTSWAESKQLVRVSINDSGGGIPEEILGKIFDPFFTTKSEWKSEGLGLTVAWQVAQRHHGSIKADSTVGRGTSMQLTFPAAPVAHLK